jgi:hypothetical protein
MGKETTLKFTRFIPISTLGAVAGLTFLAFSLIPVATPARAEERENKRLHIVKDCGTFSGVPGSSYCTIITSDVPELPSGSQIYYDQTTGGPAAGPGYLDSNIFVYVQPGQWATGRCTVPNDNTPGICALTDGIGPLAGITARINVTFEPGGDGQLYVWKGSYSFNSLTDR